MWFSLRSDNHSDDDEFEETEEEKRMQFEEIAENGQFLFVQEATLSHNTNLITDMIFFLIWVLNKKKLLKNFEWG